MKKYPSEACSSNSRTLRRYVVVAGLVLSVGLTIAPGAVSTAYADELDPARAPSAAIEAAIQPGEGASSSSVNTAPQAEGKAATSSAESTFGVEGQNPPESAPAKSSASEASAPGAGESNSAPAGEGAASAATPATAVPPTQPLLAARRSLLSLPLKAPPRPPLALWRKLASSPTQRSMRPSPLRSRATPSFLWRTQ